MADEKPSLHIDSDWKKQAQEEKRKLAEQAQKPAPAPAAAQGTAPPPSGASIAEETRATASRGRREPPLPNFASLVQSVAAQVFYYLGELPSQGGESNVNLDMARHQIDILTMLEEKTANNLAPAETHMLDAALYETRSRFIGVASQFTGVD